MVVIIDHDKIAQLQVAGSTSCFASNALHSTAIAEDAVGVVVDYLEAWLVELGRGVSLCNCKTNSVGEALA